MIPSTHVDLWMRSRWPAGRWRSAARSAICAVLDACRIEPGLLPLDILERVDAAYPLEERAGFPYKAWLVERKAFRAALDGPAPALHADELAACEVARDMLLGDVPLLPGSAKPTPAEVVAMLEREAPNRLARKCPACGAKVGRQCVVINGVPAGEARRIMWDADLKPRLVESVTLLVPHHARLVGHLDAGPLFTAR